MKTLSVIIVTFNTGRVVLDCIESLLQTTVEMDAEIIVVDNASSDDTASLVTSHFPQIKVIRSEKNLGFGGGNNLGYRSATGEYIALVNPDLRFDSDTLSQLVNYLRMDSNVGIVGPRTQDSDGEIAITARGEYTLVEMMCRYLGFIHLSSRFRSSHERHVNFFATQPEEVAWLQGSCLVMKRTIFDAIGCFDEDYFLYFEDTDLCYRVRDAGYKVVYVPAITVTHIGGTSTRSHPYIRVRGYHISPLIYLRKRNKPWQARGLKIIFTIELLSKSAVRYIRSLFRYDSMQIQQARAELRVLMECWRF